ncbi:helix-turn-helix transcriptional regulator [Clostridium perfringens]
MENKLSFLRKNKVLSQREVASLIGKEARFIQNLERGKVKNPTASEVYKLSRIYATSMEEIYRAIVLNN